MIRRVAGAAIAALAAPAVALGHGAEPGTRAEALRHDWPAAWQPAWVEIAIVAAAAALYARRARRLGRRLPRWRAVCFAAGLAVLLLASCSPVDAVGEDGLFAVHMMQHMMIGDLAALLLVLGITGPVLQPALRFGAVQRMRALTHPVVAWALWAVLLVGWHIPALYGAALDHPAVHAVEHASFLAGGVLMWAALLEALPEPEWFGTGAKLMYVGAIRVVDMILANAFWWAGSAFYSHYEATAPIWGISAQEDQGNAGTVMMAWTGTVTLIVATVLFFRMAREGELRQELIERGLDPAAVRRAVRYGRGELLAARHGVGLGEPPGAPPRG